MELLRSCTKPSRCFRSLTLCIYETAEWLIFRATVLNNRKEMGWVQLAVLVSHCHQGASIQCKLNCLFDNLFKRKQRKDQSSARTTGPVQAESTVAYRKQKPAIRKVFTCSGDFIKKASCVKIQINHRSVYQYMSDWSEPKTQHIDSSILGGVASGHLPRFIHVSSLIKSLVKGCMFVLRGMPYYEMNL